MNIDPTQPVLGFWFVDAWTKFPRAEGDPFQVPWFSDMWKTVEQA